MRIAFVGKGGSGKTTLSALFIQHIAKKYPVLAIDADLNMHLGALLGFKDEIPSSKHLSDSDTEKAIKTHFKGRNDRIKELAHFRKTTPPTAESNFIRLGNGNDPILSQFSLEHGATRLLVVGTYQGEEIGASCYHNDLAILENVLSHTIDTNGVIVADMVAGVDAFANTLHVQFDMLVLVVEPTKRGIEVFKQYQNLAQQAGVYESLVVVGNKMRSKQDKEFLTNNVPAEKIVGFLGESDYLRLKDQEGGVLELDLLEPENGELLSIIESRLFAITPNPQKRLEKLFDLHRRYVDQAFIKERYGDLTGHIDPEFNIAAFITQHENRR